MLLHFAYHCTQASMVFVCTILDGAFCFLFTSSLEVCVPIVFLSFGVLPSLFLVGRRSVGGFDELAAVDDIFYEVCRVTKIDLGW